MPTPDRTPPQQTNILTRFLRRPATVWTALGILVLFVGLLAPPPWLDNAREKLDSRSESTVDRVFSKRLDELDSKLTRGDRVEPDAIKDNQVALVLRQILEAGPMKNRELKQAFELTREHVDGKALNDVDLIALVPKLVQQFPRLNERILREELAEFKRQIAPTEQQ